MSYKTVLLKKEEAVAVITLNRPDKLNAIDATMIAELTLATEEISQDKEVRAVLLTGAGRAFSAGADISLVGGPPLEIRENLLKFGRIVLNLKNMMKTGAVRVNGLIDRRRHQHRLRLRHHSRRRYGDHRHGVCPAGAPSGWRLTYHLPQRVGYVKACELIFTGKVLDAREAERIGLINQVVPAANLQAEAFSLAAKLAKGATFSLGMARLSLQAGAVHGPARGDRVGSQGAEPVSYYRRLGGGLKSPAREETPGFLKENKMTKQLQ